MIFLWFVASWGGWWFLEDKQKALPGNCENHMEGFEVCLG